MVTLNVWGVFFFCWPINAGRTLRPTLCQRRVLRRLSGRFNFRWWEPDKRSQWQ